MGTLTGDVGNLIRQGYDAAVDIGESVGRSISGGANSLVQYGKNVWNTGPLNYVEQVNQSAGDAVEDWVLTPMNLGPLTDLEDPETSPFGFDTLQYPIGDLLVRYPYFITFYFNVPTARSRYNSHYKGVEADENGGIKNINDPAGLPTRERNRRQGGTGQPPSFSIPGTKGTVDVTRTTFRTAQSIRLYMPDTMQWNFRQQWRDPHLSDSGLVSTSAPLASLTEGVQSGTMSGLQAGAAQAAKLIASKFLDKLPGGLPEGVALSSMGFAVNPMIDVIYTSPDLRTFTMEFLFAPRNSAEAVAARRIIRAFKFFSAPEVPQVSGYGYLMIPPGDIDIEFSISTVGKISTCVLQNIDLDYAPNGFAAYQNPQDITDGMPVNIRMRLEFTETEYITKDLVARGY